MGPPHRGGGRKGTLHGPNDEEGCRLTTNRVGPTRSSGSRGLWEFYSIICDVNAIRIDPLIIKGQKQLAEGLALSHLSVSSPRRSPSRGAQTGLRFRPGLQSGGYDRDDCMTRPGEPEVEVQGGNGLSLDDARPYHADAAIAR
jgi:hypothetical protein